MSANQSKTIVVVGAAGGIGLEIVRQLRGRARVLGVVQNDQQIAAAREAGADQCLVCDVADAASAEASIAAVLADCAASLAGVIFTAALQPVGAVEVMPRSELEKLFAVNFFGTLQFVQGLIPALRSSRGRIVLFSSMAGRTVMPVLGAYSASKHALEAYADAMRIELQSSGVSVSLIEPGGVDTPMARSQGAQVERAISALSLAHKALYESLYRGYLKTAENGLKNASKPEDVARVAVEAVIGDARPRARYVVGKDAKLVIGLAGLLPTRTFDRLLFKMMGQ